MTIKGRKFSAKQIRYLWAIGYFKTSPNHSKYKVQALSASNESAPKVFQSKNEANDWASKTLGSPLEWSTYQEHKGRDAELAKSLDNYRGPGYSQINFDLRRSSGRSLSKQSQILSESFERFSKPSPESLEVFRGVSGKFAELLHTSAFSGKLQEGSIITDYGFVSTSMDKDFARSFASGSSASGELKISVPKGTKMIYMGVRKEAELLLDRGSQFKVTKVTSSEITSSWGNKSTHIELEVQLLPTLRKTPEDT